MKSSGVAGRRFYYVVMEISEKKKKFLLKSKKAAERGVFLFFGIFVASMFLGTFAINFSTKAASLAGTISVYSALLFAFSAVILFLIQVEVWEKGI
ncbi:MAG: hypothetical protein PHF35_02725 [Candidatus Moranbacteria bacterium]|nr:hypothetical protein [Candidatus Moranbacteria bacterium]